MGISERGVLLVIRFLLRLLSRFDRNRPDPGLRKPIMKPAPLFVPGDSYGSGVRYTTPRHYDEAQAVKSAKRAQKRTETGRALPVPKRAKQPRSNVTPIRKTGTR